MGVLVTGMLAAGEHGEVIRFGALGVLNNRWGAELGHAAPQSFQRVRVDGSRVVFEFDWKNKSPEDSVWVRRIRDCCRVALRRSGLPGR